METQNYGNIPAISAVVITHNEEKRIALCLDALLRVTPDVVVVDSFSTDRTPDICQAKGVRFYQRTWTGYSDQKNYGNDLALSDWILTVDADEYLSSDLIEEIVETFKQKIEFDVCEIRIVSFFCGKRIRFGGWNPDFSRQIFNKRRIKWNNDTVHEGLTITPNHRIKRLRGHIEHFTVEKPEHYATKTELYSTLFAENAFRRGIRVPLVKAWLSALARFVSEYVLKLGFLDGIEGLYIAKENARYSYLKYRKLIDMYR